MSSPEPKGPFGTLGAVRFWAMAVGAVVFCIGYGLLMFWFSERLGWPEAYGISCRRRADCFAKQLFESGQLLQGGSRDELWLFAVLWSLPVAFVVVIGVAMARRWRGGYDAERH